MEKKEQVLEEITQELLEHLGLEAKILILTGESDTIGVKLESENPGILIGYHGETLRALQAILGLIIFRRLGEWVRLIVDVGNYRKERELKLHDLARKSAERARFLAKAVVLPPMPPDDRRAVHLAVSEIDGVISESVGEGQERQVVIKPKESNEETSKF